MLSRGPSEDPQGLLNPLHHQGGSVLLRRSGPQVSEALHGIVHGPFYHLHPLPAPSIPFCPFEKDFYGVVGTGLQGHKSGDDSGSKIFSKTQLAARREKPAYSLEPACHAWPLNSRQAQVSKAPTHTAHCSPFTGPGDACSPGHPSQRQSKKPQRPPHTKDEASKTRCSKREQGPL